MKGFCLLYIDVARSWVDIDYYDGENESVPPSRNWQLSTVEKAEALLEVLLKAGWRKYHWKPPFEELL